MRFFRMLGFAGLTFLFTVHPSVSQPEPAGTRVNGFAVKISGETMPYWSLYLTSKPALITRALNGLQLIKWETDPVPEVIQDNNVCFQWMCAFSSGTARNSFHFDLYLGRRRSLPFPMGTCRRRNHSASPDLRPNR